MTDYRNIFYAAVGWLAFFLIAPVVFGIIIKIATWWLHLIGWWWSVWI